MGNTLDCGGTVVAEPLHTFFRRRIMLRRPASSLHQQLHKEVHRSIGQGLSQVNFRFRLFLSGPLREVYPILNDIQDREQDRGPPKSARSGWPNF